MNLRMALVPLYSILVAPVSVVVASPGAAAADIAVPVESLETGIPSGTILYFGTNKFAKLASDAEAEDDALDVLPIPTALAEGDTATYQPTSPTPLLGEKWSKLGGPQLSSDERSALQLAHHLAAELALDLRAPAYTGDDAAELSFAVALQILFMLEHGITPSVVKSVSQGSPGATRNYRDRWVDPTAALIVSRVTGVVQTAYAPPPLAGV